MPPFRWPSKFAIVLVSAFAATVGAAELQVKVMKPGQNITVRSGCNANGTIHLTIDGGSGSDCLKLRGIRVCIKSNSLEVCDETSIDFTLPIVYAELRAGHA